MTTNIPSGDLDHRIAFQVATETRDAANDALQTWPESFRRWAKSTPSRGREFFGAQQVVREADREWTVRNDSDTRTVAPEKSRILEISTGVLFEIIGVTPHPKYDDCLLMTCSSRPDLRGARAPVV